MVPRSLRERLAQFDRSPAPARPTGPADRAAALEALLRGGARWVGETPTGYLRLESPPEPGLWPGPPRQCLPEEAWRRLCGRPAPPPGPWAVLDTETTGLEGGSGTLVFLVALLWWEDDGVRLVQYFLPEPAGEGRLMAELMRDLEPAAALLSYNGLAFDLPRLRTRARLQRQDDASFDRPHLDLLHPTRRLTRRWLQDARLPTVERRLLGIERNDDLPGSEAPEVYRALLADGRDAGLVRVVDHNRLDVENLLRLAARLSALVLDPACSRGLPCAAELGLGRLLDERGCPELAVGVLERVAEEGEDALAREALWHLGRLHRRTGDSTAARSCFERGVHRWPSWVEARVELAKHLEHRARDWSAAREQVRRALAAVETRELGRTADPRLRPQLTHRLRRLERRLRQAEKHEEVGRDG